MAKTRRNRKYSGGSLSDVFDFTKWFKTADNTTEPVPTNTQTTTEQKGGKRNKKSRGRKSK